MQRPRQRLRRHAVDLGDRERVEPTRALVPELRDGIVIEVGCAGEEKSAIATRGPGAIR